MSLRSGPGGARSDPRGPKTAPRAARSEPRVRREPPKRLPKGIQIVVFVVSAPGAPPGGLRERFWRDFGLDFGCSGHHFGAILGRLWARFSNGLRLIFRRVGGSPRCCPCWLNSMFVLFMALRLGCFLSLPRDRAGKPREHRTRNSRNAPSSKRPAQAAQRPSKGIQRSTLLAICILALLSPRLLCCSSWPCALVSLVVLASLLVFCVVCNACGSRVERASRSMMARFLLV